jgi:quinol monooxygenase YgiN
MEKVALVVKIEYKPEGQASFLKALSEHKQRCLATEPGTLQFEILDPVSSTNAVLLFELYENSQALDAHNAGSSLAVFKEQAGPSITNISVQQCAVPVL